MTPKQLRDAANGPCASAFHGRRKGEPYRALLSGWDNYDATDDEGLPKMACFFVCAECGLVETCAEPMS